LLCFEISCSSKFFYMWPWKLWKCLWFWLVNVAVNACQDPATLMISPGIDGERIHVLKVSKVHYRKEGDIKSMSTWDHRKVEQPTETRTGVVVSLLQIAWKRNCWVCSKELQLKCMTSVSVAIASKALVTPATFNVLSVMPADMTPCLARRSCRSFDAVDLQIDLWKIRTSRSTWWNRKFRKEQSFASLPKEGRICASTTLWCAPDRVQMRNNNNTWLLAVMQLIVFGRRERYHDVLSYQQMFLIGERTQDVRAWQAIRARKSDHVLKGEDSRQNLLKIFQI
jgi:hypothetical protein